MFPASHSPVPGYDMRCARREEILSAIEAMERAHLDRSAVAEEVEAVFGAEGIRVLTGLRWARGETLGHGSRRDPAKGDDVFYRMALDDLLRGVHGLSELVPTLGFVGRARDSIYNAMVVYVQNPEARDWRTRDAWEKAGRTVREGGQPLLTLFPFGPFLIKYDIADTDGPTVEQGPGLFAGQGEVPASFLDKLRAHLEVQHILVRENRPLGGTSAGSVRLAPWGAIVELEMRVSRVSQFGTLLHELAHLYLGHLGKDPGLPPEPGKRNPKARWPDRTGLHPAAMEIEAEAVAWLLCTRLGLITSGPEYIADHLRTLPPDEPFSLELILRAAMAIERLLDAAEKGYPESNESTGAAPKGGSRRGA